MDRRSRQHKHLGIPETSQGQLWAYTYSKRSTLGAVHSDMCGAVHCKIWAPWEALDQL